MVERIYDSILEQFQDELADYNPVTAPSKYKIISTHGDTEHEEFARYELTHYKILVTDSEVPDAEDVCEEIITKIRTRPEVEHAKIMYKEEIFIEVYLESQGNK